MAVLVFLGWTLWGRSLGWDELEFARATSWVAHGQVPYRDFWEHHAPLQWFLLAPWGRLVGGAGTAELLRLRAGQLPFWFLVLGAGFLLLKRHRISGPPALLSLILPLLSPCFTLWAVEYRPDTLGTTLLVTALCLWRMGRGRRGAMTAGVLLGGTVLANLRLAPLAMLLLVGMALVRPAGRRWRYNHRAPWVMLGFGLLFGAWGLYLGSTQSFGVALSSLVGQNAWFNRYLQAQPGTGDFARVAFLPFTEGDPAGMILALVVLAGSIAGLLRVRRPGLGSLLAILQVLQLGGIAQLGVHYPYHFQGVLLVAGLQAGAAWQEPVFAWLRRSERLLVGLFAILVLFAGYHLSVANGHRNLTYQDYFMREVDRTTAAGDPVLDAVGYALHRQPAYHLWFLPTLARSLAREGKAAPYTSGELLQHAPGAIVFSGRTGNWISEWPQLQAPMVSHYLPELPRLWLPGLSTRLAGPGMRQTWTVPRTGTYRLLASEALADHPWFQQPFRFVLFRGPSSPTLSLDPAEHPPAPNGLVWTLDDTPLAGTGDFVLRRGSRLTALSRSIRPLGIFLLPLDLPARFQGSPVGISLDTDLYQLWETE